MACAPLEIRDQDLEASYWPAFLGLTESRQIFADLQQQTDWQQGQIRLFGKELPEPRLSAWYGDAAYSYSGKTMPPKPWTPLLQKLKKRVESICLSHFNAVLLNLYRDGQDSMGLHSDDEPELGPDPVIASLSLGAPRRFVLRHKQDPKRRQQIKLADGSLLLMAGQTQAHWKHELPKVKDLSEARINLTFRLIRTP